MLQFWIFYQGPGSRNLSSGVFKIIILVHFHMWLFMFGISVPINLLCFPTVVHPHTSSVPEEAPAEHSSREENTSETRSGEQELPLTRNSEDALNPQHSSASSWDPIFLGSYIPGVSLKDKITPLLSQCKKTNLAVGIRFLKAMVNAWGVRADGDKRLAWVWRVLRLHAKFGEPWEGESERAKPIIGRRAYDLLTREKARSPYPWIPQFQLSTVLGAPLIFLYSYLRSLKNLAWGGGRIVTYT